MRIPTLLSPPMTAQEFHVLLALYLEESHIYSLKGAVYNQSRGSIVLEDGTLYPLIKRMEKQALIDNVGKKPAGKSGRLRNYYKISEDGYIRLQEELSRYKHVVEIAGRTDIFENETPTDIQWMMLKTRGRSG